ncbi:hydroxymethylbilane synthase [Hydrotalea sp.]|uniref:hydroxymethylbilane synthase n=1 Tax=Hydrotalea sp. TaxID=2881279 RepID=UPI002618D16C|nr:hydroxymethylbilane synthase [Hydrotalea sp.]
MGIIKIGTRESQLAVWQATLVQTLLSKQHIQSELKYIKSDGDIDLVTPLYALGVQGVFTKTLDAALLSNKIDIAVHSMKDVPTQLAKGILQAAVLPRASYQDILVFKKNTDFLSDPQSNAVIATSSIRRKAQWLHRYPNHTIENLRGNVNTRLQKVADNEWHGAIFAAAGLERIALRPEQSIHLDWMLPAPAQGAIVIVCREKDTETYQKINQLNDFDTDLCTKIERDFLQTLMGGCSTPISALATVERDEVYLKGNITSPDGKLQFSIEKKKPLAHAATIGLEAGAELLQTDAKKIIESIHHAKQ